MLWILFSIDSRLTLYMTVRALPLYTYPSISFCGTLEIHCCGMSE
jgi:hypothetical protein